MKAAQYVSQGKIEFVEIPDPTPNDGEIVVQLDKGTVCGSDVFELYYQPKEQFPKKPGASGHEIVGTVVSANSGGLRPEDRVLVIPPNFDGWVEYLSVTPNWLVPIPDVLPTEHGLMAQLLGCVIWALKKAPNLTDKNVAVIGQGPAGLLFTKLLSNMGARRVIGLDLEDYRLEVAKQMGATDVLNNSGRDSAQTAEFVRDVTEGGMADYVIEVVGLDETVNLASDLGREFADLLIFGIPKTQHYSLDFWNILRKQQALVTTVGTQAEPNLQSFRLGMQMIADGRVDVSPLLTHHLPFESLPKALELAHKRKDGAVKVVVDISGE